MVIKIKMIDGKNFVQFIQGTQVFTLEGGMQRKEATKLRHDLEICFEEFKKEIIRKCSGIETGIQPSVSGYITIPVQKKKYVLKQAETRKGTIYDDANFMGTGMALCGVLKNGETLQTWIARTTLARQMRNKDI